MTARYEKLDVQFLYPENWQITEEETVDWPRSVSIQNPDGAFWSLMIYDDQQDPDELADLVLAAMQEEYEGLEAARICDEFDDVEAVGYDMHFYCFDFIVNSRTLGIRLPTRTMLLIWQAEDRQFEMLEPVFRAITTSLLQQESQT